jgi:hypothetical protein
MKLSTVLTLNSIVALVVSIGLVLVPSNVILIYGGTTDTVGLFLARHYGATGIAIGVLTWLLRNISIREARQAILPALLSVFLVEFVMDLFAQLGGMLNALGWSIVVLDLLFVLAYGYFLFVKPVVAEGK